MSDETARHGGGGGGDDRRGGFVRDKDMIGAAGEGKLKSRKRRKVSYLTLNKIETVDYKDVNILRRFINDRGKILPSRQSGNTAKQQRMIARAIRRARELALLPFVVGEMSTDRREFTPRRDRGMGDRDRDRYGDRDRDRDRDRGPREPVATQATQAAPAAEAVAAPAPEAPSAEAAAAPAE
jgi:small subunit ribosomal protein S18